jgi:deoxyribodipyrimidine photo-lyase
MSSKYENGLFIFRRDLRLTDNIGINLLNDNCKNIYTIFIFTPEQVGSSNKYKSVNSVQFMIESLESLSSHIKKSGGHLYTFYGKNEKVIADCIKAWNIDVVCFNLDITPYARERDDGIVKLCNHFKIDIITAWDYYLCKPDDVLSGSGKPYVKFTPFYETAKKIKVLSPARAKTLHLRKSEKQIPNKISLEQAFNKFTEENKNIMVHGGREEAIKILKTAVKTQKHYGRTRDEIAVNTSLLSAYLKFGCVSIREVYAVFKRNHDFIRQLYWRDFYGQLLYYNPHVLGHAMKPNYNKIKWHHNERWFKAWTNGMTGYPIVDAAMRQLNTCGWMHNRGRMLTSSFLVKTLLIDWRKGEQYYANKLTDYDPANNNGGWQWSASTGADSQPYFRIFNPWIQSKEHDPDCEYIKKWLPELKEVPNKDIHNWFKECIHYKNVDYPKPICDYEDQKEKSLKMYSTIF